MNISVADAVQTVVLLGCEPGDIAPELAKKKTIRVAAGDAYAVLPALYEALQNGHVLAAVAEENGEMCALCHSLNNLGQNKIAVLCGGTTDDTALRAELERQSVRTAGGEMQFLPQPTQHPLLFTAEGRLLLRGSSPQGEPLFDSGGNAWGTLLPEAVCMECLAGTLCECRTSLTPEEKKAAAEQLCAAETCAAPENILIFRTAGGIFPLELPGAETVPSCDAALFIWTGLAPSAPTDTMLRALCTLPSLQTAVSLAGCYCTGIFA